MAKAPQFVVNILDRVGSTVVQSFAGTATALTATGTLGTLGDWRQAALAAGVAGLLSLAKVLGVQAASAPPATVVEHVVQSAAPADTAAVVNAIASKLARNTP